MYVNGQPVLMDANVWQQARLQHAQPSTVIPIRFTAAGTVEGKMQLIKVNQGPSGILWVMPNSDAVYNYIPEVRPSAVALRHARLIGCRPVLLLVCTMLVSLAAELCMSSGWCNSDPGTCMQLPDFEFWKAYASQTKRLNER